MDIRQRNAITAFGCAVQELKDAGVIRSHRYLGDIAEFLCADAYGIDLEKNLRTVGHDGMREELRAQIKYGGGEKTNMDFGNPGSYDEVYIVLGKESKIRDFPDDSDFLIYVMTSEEVKAIEKTPKGKYSRGITHFRRIPDKSISLK